MKNESLYHKTISILVKAYLNNTLEHGNCFACAVGNMVAGNNDIMFTKSQNGEAEWDGLFLYPAISGWAKVFCTAYPKPYIKEENYIGEAKRQIDSTGYNFYDLAKIEVAFEAVPVHLDDEDRMYGGLMAVVEVLGEIHEVSKELTEETKLMFVKA